MISFAQKNKNVLVDFPIDKKIKINEYEGYNLCKLFSAVFNTFLCSKSHVF
jgi:hypothetical protein